MMAIYWGMQEQEIFLASCGNDTLLYGLDKSFSGRKVGIYPDMCNMGVWTKIAEYFQNIQAEHVELRTKFIERVWRPEDGNEADYKTILMHMLEDRRAGRTQRVEEIVRDMIAENPFFEDLIKSLKLTPI
jgi:hypothetical protein